MPLGEQGLSLCPAAACLMQTEAEIEGEGAEVTECARWKEATSALILLWHNKTIRGGLFTKLDYSAPVRRPIWGVISWDGSVHRAPHNTMGMFKPRCCDEKKTSFIFIWRVAPEFPVTTSCSNSRGRCSTDTGHCLQWGGSPVSSRSQNPPSKEDKERIRTLLHIQTSWICASVHALVCCNTLCLTHRVFFHVINQASHLPRDSSAQQNKNKMVKTQQKNTWRWTIRTWKLTIF